MTVADLLHGEQQPARRRLTRAMVEDETLRLIDEGGLDAATMRAVAGRLGVTPRALYRHVADKHDLLRGVAGRILGQVRLPSPALPSRVRIEAVVAELRRVMEDHPHAVPVFTRRGSSAPTEVVAITDLVIGALLEAGVDGETAVRTFYALFNYTLGFVVLGADGTLDQTTSAPDPFAGLDPTVLPHAVEVAPFLQRFVNQGMRASDAQFRFGLNLLLDAITP
jgi:AcrR family transcriptional regulator